MNEDYLIPLRNSRGYVTGYIMTRDYLYYSERYDRYVLAKKGDIFDGATGAMDIDSLSWVIHDVLCRDGMFKDASDCTNWQASMILHDILKSEGRWFRKHTWFFATFLFGGGKARKNSLY